MKRTWNVLLVMLGAHTAWSQPQNADYRAGVELFRKGEYLAAAGKFREAYEADSDAGYLFNIAQAYRFAHECVLSAQYYRSFLAAMPNPPNLEQVRGWLATQDACAAEKNNARSNESLARDEPPPRDEPPARDEPEPPPTQRVGEVIPSTPAKVRHESDPRLRLAIGSAVVAVIGVGVGAYFTHDASALSHERESLCAGGCVWSEVRASVSDLDARGQRASAIAVASYGISAVALAGSVGLYVTRHHSPVAVVPVGGGALASAAWRF
jgi:hypothetical protein